MPNEEFVRYARPLIEGQLPVPVEHGLPKFAVLARQSVAQKLPVRK
jgi:6-phosphofructokinase 1